MKKSTTIEYDPGAALAEARNQDAMEEAEEPEEPQETQVPREKKMDWGTGFLMGMVGLFFGVLSAIPGIGFVLNGIGVGFIWLWWVSSGLKPPTLGFFSKIPLVKKSDTLGDLDAGEKISRAVESVPVLGKFAAFFLPLILGIIPGTGVLMLPGLVWAIYRANS